MKEDNRFSNKAHSTPNYSTVFLDKKGNDKEEFQPKVVSTLITLLTDEANKELKEKALAELRNENGKKLLMYAISSTKKHPKLPSLVASCWEAGIDFSEEISFFVDLALDCDYLVCLEALTVIESAKKNIDKKQITDSIKKLDAEIQRGVSPKINFYPEIISALTNKL